MSKQNYILGILRIAIGSIFLWAFIDKAFGFGFATESGKSWLSGNSPTEGFLKFGTSGPFSTFFQNLAGISTIDWFFMLGMLFIGLALILGIGIRIAALAGSIMMLLIYVASFPVEQNPFVDEHIIYILVLVYFYFTHPGRYLGLGKWWQETNLVKKNKFLE